MSDAPNVPTPSTTRLTRDAREALEDAVDTYRARLLVQVELDHPTGEISGIDLLRSVYADPTAVDSARLAADLRDHEEIIEYLEARQSRATRLGVFSVLIAGVLAAGAAIVPNLLPFIGGWNLAVVIVFLGGSFVLGGSAVLRNTAIEEDLKRAREDRKARERDAFVRQAAPSERSDAKDAISTYRATGAFLEGWHEIERLLNALGDYHLDTPPGKRLSFATTLKQLSYRRVLTDYEVQKVRSLLTIRNDLVHGELPRNYNLDGALPDVRQAVSTLQSAIERVTPTAKVRRGKKYVDKFLQTDAAKDPLPKIEDERP